MEKSFLDLVSYCLNYLESFETLRINHKELSRPLGKNEAKNICKDNIWSFFVRVWFSLSLLWYIYRFIYFMLLMDSISIKKYLTLFRMGLFMAAQEWRNGEAKRPTLSKICHTYPTMMKLDTRVNHVTHSLSSAIISIFSQEISKFCYIKKHRYRLRFDT